MVSPDASSAVVGRISRASEADLHLPRRGWARDVPIDAVHGRLRVGVHSQRAVPAHDLMTLLLGDESTVDSDKVFGF
jgi:hypothetical protein